MSSQKLFILKILILTGLSLRTIIGLQSIESSSHALTDEEYRTSIGKDYLYFEIIDPVELAYTYKANPAIFAPSWNTTLNNIQLVPADPSCGCGRIVNDDEIEGHIALIQRGECSFVSKVIRAQEAGAAAVIVTDEDEDQDQLFIAMADDTTGREVSIPAAFVLGKNGHVIKNTLTKLSLPHAVINVPVNISRIAPYKLKQPPWIVWWNYFMCFLLLAIAIF